MEPDTVESSDVTSVDDSGGSRWRSEYGGVTGAVWRVSSRCAGNGACIEVAALTPDIIGVRDGKQAGTGPVLEFSREDWRAFIASLRSGNFDSI